MSERSPRTDLGILHADGAWFWRRLKQAQRDFNALPEWMKKKDYAVAALTAPSTNSAREAMERMARDVTGSKRDLDEHVVDALADRYWASLLGCGRCGGTGAIPAGPYGGGRDRCFVCGGSGSVSGQRLDELIADAWPMRHNFGVRLTLRSLIKLAKQRRDDQR